MKVFVPYCESLLGQGASSDALGELVPFSHEFACLRSMRAEIVEEDGTVRRVEVPNSAVALERALDGCPARRRGGRGLVVAEA